MPGGVDLPDVNVWLALTVADHVHHVRALRYWREEAAPRAAFTRVTALGFVRLLTNSTVMAGRALEVASAWGAYAAFRKLPEVAFVAEPSECENRLAAWALSQSARPRLWTDAYLAAFAAAAGLRLVSFDVDFPGFEGLERLHLR